MHPTLLLLAPVSEFLIRALEESFTCRPGWTSDQLEHTLKEHAADIRGIVMGGGTVVSLELLDRLPALEILAVNGVGYDGVPLAACRQRGLKVTNTPGVLTEDVADIALALVLMTFRGLIRANRALHAGRWADGFGTLTRALAGKRVGILGLGHIGKAIARRLVACGMEVGYHGRSRQQVEWTWFDSLSALAHWSDSLIVACPGGPMTQHLVNEHILRCLGPTGVLINIARGSVVDEAALIRMLEQGCIAGAGLDVYEDEPTVPEPLLKREDVVLLPHVGSATRETREAMARLVADNLHAHFDGQPLLTPV
jgi:hydroxypyruvate reductase